MCPKFSDSTTDQQKDFIFTSKVSASYVFEPHSAVGPDNASLDDTKNFSNAPEAVSTCHMYQSCTGDTNEVTVLQNKPHEIVEIKEEYIIEKDQILFKDEQITIKDPWPGSIKEVITKQVDVPKEINDVGAHQINATQDKEFQKNNLEQEQNKFPLLDSGHQVLSIHQAFDGFSAKSHSHREEYKEVEKQFSPKLQIAKDTNFAQNEGIKTSAENQKINVFSETFRDVTEFRCFSIQHPSLKQKKSENSFYGSYACRSTQHPSLKVKGKGNTFDENSRTDNQEMLPQINLLTRKSNTDKDEQPVVTPRCYQIGQNGSLDFKSVKETKLDVFGSYTVFDESEIVIHCLGNPIVDEKKIYFVTHKNFDKKYEIQKEIAEFNVEQRKLNVNKSLDNTSARNTSVSLITQTINFEFSFHETDNEYDQIQSTQSTSPHNKSQFIAVIQAPCFKEQRTHVLSLIAKKVKVSSFAYFVSTNLLFLLSLTFAFFHLNHSLWKSRPPPTKHPPAI